MRIVLFADQFDEPRAPRGGVAVRDERLDRRRQPRGNGRSGQAEIGQAARSRSGSSECRRGSARYIPRCRSGRSGLRFPRTALRSASARHRPRADAKPRHKSRARPGRGRRAVRDREAPPAPCRPTDTRSRTRKVASASRPSATAATSRQRATRLSAASLRRAATGMIGPQSVEPGYSTTRLMVQRTKANSLLGQGLNGILLHF